MEVEEIIQVLTEGLQELYRNDSHLLHNETSERCVLAVLLHYLRLDSRVNGLNIDVEYNREGSEGNPKKIYDRATTADLLIHTRGDIHENNLLYLEAKMGFSITRRSREQDIDMIKYFVNQFNYSYGVFLEIKKDRTILEICNSQGEFSPPINITLIS